MDLFPNQVIIKKLALLKIDNMIYHFSPMAKRKSIDSYMSLRVGEKNILKIINK